MPGVGTFSHHEFRRDWEILPLPTQPNAAMWGIAAPPVARDRIVAFSLFATGMH